MEQDIGNVEHTSGAQIIGRRLRQFAHLPPNFSRRFSSLLLNVGNHGTTHHAGLSNFSLIFTVGVKKC